MSKLELVAQKLGWRKRAPSSVKLESPSTRRPATKRERLFTGTATGTLVTFAVILTGATVSLFTKGIRDSGAVFFALPSEDSLNGVFIFWCAVFATLCLLTLNLKFSAIKSKREQEDLDNSLRGLDNAVRRLNTLPSEIFLPAYQDSYRQAFSAAMLVVVDETATVENSEQAIRAVLAAIADTAKDFDGASTRTIYGANIMLFRDRSAPAFSEAVTQLVDIGPSHKEYVGSLELMPNLSTCSNKPGHPDTLTAAISLPVPSNISDFYDRTSRTTKSSVLPGAPTAYAKGAFDCFDSIDVFLEKLHNDTTLDRHLIDRVEKYFTDGQGAHIKSFASLPIPALMAFDIAKVDSPPDSSEIWTRTSDESRPLGVLNIHSESSGLLADNGSSLFAPLMAPFLALLAILIIKREDLQQSARAYSASSPPPISTKGVAYETVTDASQG